MNHRLFCRVVGEEEPAAESNTETEPTQPVVMILISAVSLNFTHEMLKFHLDLYIAGTEGILVFKIQVNL